MGRRRRTGSTVLWTGIDALLIATLAAVVAFPLVARLDAGGAGVRPASDAPRRPGRGGERPRGAADDREREVSAAVSERRARCLLAPRPRPCERILRVAAEPRVPALDRRERAGRRHAPRVRAGRAGLPGRP